MIGYSKWIDFKKVKPSRNGIFLTYHPGGDGYQDSICVEFYDQDEELFCGEYHGPHPVSHWQELPMRPELTQ